jgi:hypothetical protein
LTGQAEMGIALMGPRASVRAVPLCRRVENGFTIAEWSNGHIRFSVEGDVGVILGPDRFRIVRKSSEAGR